MAICLNSGERPDSCNFLTPKQVAKVKIYNFKRLKHHNKRRALHQNTDPLVFDLDIACQAQYWATEHAMRVEELDDITVNDDRLVHYNDDKLDLPALNPRQGENLAWRWRSPKLLANNDWEEEAWYDSEEPNYNYETG